MRASRAVALCAALSSSLVPLLAPVAAADKPLLGFSPESSAAQRALEGRFDEWPRPWADRCPA